MFNAGRPQGVTIPAEQSQPGRGKPKSLIDVAVMEHIAVAFCDDAGRQHNVVLAKVGKEYYMAPNSEAWAAELRPVLPWLQDAIDSELRGRSETLPTEDRAEVVASEIAKSAGVDVV
jgi:hypothetical protein